MKPEEDKIYVEIGDRIRQIRENNGESQEELAKIIGCTQVIISKIENGTISLNAYRLNKIAEHYHVSCDFFCKEKGANDTLTLLLEHVRLRYDECPYDDTTKQYPVLEIDTALLNYLFQMAQWENMNNIPEKARIAWQEAAKKEFNDASNKRKLEKIAFIPFPETQISKDNTPNFWHQDELLQKTNDNLSKLFS